MEDCDAKKIDELAPAKTPPGAGFGDMRCFEVSFPETIAFVPTASRKIPWSLSATDVDVADAGPGTKPSYTGPWKREILWRYPMYPYKSNLTQ